MAKSRRRRGSDMASKKNDIVQVFHDQPSRRNYRLYGIVAGISACVIFAIYFAFSAPSLEKTLETIKSSSDWQSDRENWSLEPLQDKEFELVSDGVELERLKNEYLRNILIVRTPGSKNITKVKNFIASTLQKLSWDVEEHTFKDSPPASYSKNPVTFTNIIATHNPYARRRLVLACHYDSKVTPKGFLGATDSAVPCAMLLEIAEALETYLLLAPRDSDVTLQLIFFDGEEAFVKWTSHDSIYGARNLAQKWQEQRWPPNSDGSTTVLDAIDLFVLLDLIGEKHPTIYDKINVHSTNHYKDLVRIERRIQREGDSVHFFNEMRVNSYIEDDHIPFLKRGVPILHIIPQTFPINWHKITDNGENLHYPTIEKLSKVFAVFVAEYLHLKPVAF